MSWSAREVLRSSGDGWEERGVNWEVATGIAVLLAGADVVVVRHPRSLKTLKGFIEKVGGA